MSERPTCQYCGKPIPKRTVHLQFGARRAYRHSDHWIELEARPTSKAEAQRFTNHPIIQARYWTPEGRREVMTATAWDGESYISPHFCKNACAESWARWFLAQVDAGAYAIRAGAVSRHSPDPAVTENAQPLTPQGPAPLDGTVL